MKGHTRCLDYSSCRNMGGWRGGISRCKGIEDVSCLQLYLKPRPEAMNSGKVEQLLYIPAVQMERLGKMANTF